MQLVFLTSSRGNRFMVELLEALADAVRRLGVPTATASDRYPTPDEESAFVVVTHEFFALADRLGDPDDAQLGRTIGLSVEQPGTEWFDTTLHYARSLGAVMDIRQSSIRALAHNGLDAGHLQLGYTPYWDRWERDVARERPIDVACLCSLDQRRERVIAGWGPTLWPRNCHLRLAGEAPKTYRSADYLGGEDKLRMLANAKTLLNLHRSNAVRFEWVRALEAMCNGCVVVSERSLDFEPLVPGEHLVMGRAEHLALLADGLLEDEAARQRMALATYDHLRAGLTMQPGAERLAAVAEELLARPVRRRSRPGALPPPAVSQAKEVGTEVSHQLLPSMDALKRVLIDLRELRRELDRRSGGPAAARPASVLHVTPAHTQATPRVSVLISLFNYRAEVQRALASVVASEFEDLELLVLDDASTDGSAQAVLDFLKARPWLPAQLLGHPTNRGLGPTRNELVRRARGDLVFILDADNHLYPPALTRLVDALNDSPDALFSYPIIGAELPGRLPEQLVSWRPWDPAWLARENPIDAMALIRRDPLLELGAYTEDPRLVGLEDYDLWCRAAAAGHTGVQVPAPLAGYRLSEHSMLSLTRLSGSEARSLIRSRAPAVFSQQASGAD